MKSRIAVFSPVSPVPSGISDYCGEFLRLLADDVDFHLFVDDYDAELGELANHVEVSKAARFDEINAESPFDLSVYHIGNSPYHEYIYPYLYKHPGMMVLHDAWLMGTRLNKAMENWEGDQFRAELEAIYGEKGDAIAEIILSGLHNGTFLRHVPMIELQVRASLMTVVHNPWLAGTIAADNPGAVVRAIPHRMPVPLAKTSDVERVRAQYGLPPKSFIIGNFGVLAPAKGILSLLRAFKWVKKRIPEAALMLVGGIGTDLPLESMLKEQELDEEVIVTGRVPDDDFYALMNACDAVTVLRWPTNRESSAIIINAMHYRLPIVSSDLAHYSNYPEDTMLRVSTVNEEESLRRGLLKLAQCPPLRKRIGDTARKFITTEHSEAAVKEKWLELFEEGVSLFKKGSHVRPQLPKHLIAD